MSVLTSSEGAEPAAWDDALAIFVERDWAELRACAPAGLAAAWDAIGACVQAEEREELRALCLRTLVLELNCARVLGQLVGETPEARFAAFCARFRDEAGWTALFAEYAVLGATLEVVRRNFRAQVAELFARLAEDRAALVALGVPAEAALVEAAASLSDPHRGGRGVWRLAFAGGAQVMYKPKPLAVDARFQGVLARCNDAIERGELAVPPLRLLRLVDRGAYGWVEHLAAAPCADDAAAARFYARQGALLAVLHALLGTDMHYENLIAQGEHPIVVDLETLFHPFVAGGACSEAEPTARGAAEALLERSVLRVGLLPWRALQRGGKAGINVGAVGDDAPQALPFLVPRWAGAGRDDMRLEERQVALPAADNVPRVGARVAPFHEHVEAIAAGFEAMARHLSRERAAWVAPGGVLDAFARDPIRYILRPTRTYAKVLMATAHPDHLRAPASGAAVRRVLDEVRDAAAASPTVRAAEDAELAARDVPYFGGTPGSPDVHDARGERAMAFAEAPLELARARVAALDDAEVARQCWYARAALAAAAFAHAVPRFARPASAADDPARDAAPRAVALAAELGAQLAARAVDGRDGVAWIGLVDVAADAYSVAPLGADLYDGTAGIALFLAALGRATGEDRFLALADRAARTVRAALAAAPAGSSAGGFVGAPSQLYALAHVGALLGESPRALDEPLARTAAALAAAPAEPDVIYGAAGALLALLAVQRATGREALLPHLLACLAVLERTAEPFEPGVAWRTASAARPLLGFSHGTAGIACALAHLGDLLAEAGHPAAARATALADGALRYERARFDAARRNWPDFRAPDAAGRNLVAWCHGAPGVVLGRLAAPRDAAARAELDLGVSTTLATERTSGHSLCHGTVGNLAIVAHAAHRLGRADWRAGVAARLPALLAALAAGPALDAAFTDAAPGLMTGLAGVGFGLLALARPAQTPCVLALAPP